jgi:two-component system cell cycle sensor histidine kinase/response regulator CckA
MAPPLRLLVVDDAPEHARMVAEFIRSGETWADAEIHVAASYREAIAAFDAHAYDVAFFDYWLDAKDGLSLLREVRQRGVLTPVIMLTSRGAEDIAVEAMKAGAADYLSKMNLTVESLGRTIRHAIALHAGEQQRWQAEAALRASEERFRALVENSSDALLLLDAEGRVTYLTPSSMRHLGWQPGDIVGRSLLNFLHPDDRDRAEERMAEAVANLGQPVTQEVRFHHADGSWRIMEGVAVSRLSDPAVAGVVINARDITERRKLEDQLRQSQKMEAVGQLAGGVAHDFNNMLTAILGYCHLLLDEMPDEHPMRLDLLEIQAAGDRAASLTRQLLAFSRRQMLQPQVVRINTLVGQMEKLLRRLISEDMELVIVLAPELRTITVDPASVEQVLVSLTVNARDAMPDGGRLTIETANVEVNESLATTHLQMTPGPYVMIAVGDTGEGMDATTQRRVFEPFFTTREQGRGSGLGLATVYGIVKQSGGYIWVYSEPGHGTVFKVYLPVTDAVLSTSDGDVPLGSETVLLVEDEEAVRAIAGEVLRRHGYTVFSASHGEEAVRMALQHPHDIHLMVTDVVMPRMSGRELADHLAQVRPAMKQLFMSGYTDHVVMQRDLAPGVAFLQKPFTPEVFARKVRAVLDAEEKKG